MHNLASLTLYGSITLSCAGLAEGTNAATIKTTAVAHYMINEETYFQAATNNIQVTPCAVQADLTTCMYLVTIDNEGAVTVSKGTEQLTGSELPLYWSSVPANSSVLGAIKVVTSGATFTAGTTDLGAEEVTVTYYNYMTLPSRLLLA